MAVLMGGRAAEKIVFDEISTGAADDLDKATEIARQMVTRFGMSEVLGQSVYEPSRHAFLGDAIVSGQTKSYSEETAREIDVAVRQLVDEAFSAAVDILKKRRKDLEKGAKLLLENETISPDEFPPLLPKE
jgi:cell division protease FtsH